MLLKISTVWSLKVKVIIVINDDFYRLYETIQLKKI